MDGAAAARELIVAPRSAAGRLPSARGAFVVDVAGASGPALNTPPCASGTVARKDDEAIRRLLRETVFAGEIGLSLEREPDCFAAAAIEGDVRQTLVARDRASGRVVATAGRSVRDVYLNGRPARVGYLGGLRIDPSFRHRRLLDAGFEMCRILDEGDDVRLYLLSVIAGNTAARKMLERRRAGRPAFEGVERFVTLALQVGRDRRTSIATDVQLLPGSQVGAAAIVDCLNRNCRRYQFAPCWTVKDLQSHRTRDLKLDDFAVAIRRGAVVGCIACWDQRAFKQVVVRRYSPELALFRPLVNLFAPLTGVPRLPAVGARLEFAYLSHLAADDDDTEIFDRLVVEGLRVGRRKRVDCVALGLPARSALAKHAQRSLRHRAYESMLYVGFWPDGEPLAGSLDGRPSNPELAIL